MDSHSSRSFMDAVLNRRWFGFWIVNPEVTRWVNGVILAALLLSVDKLLEKVGKAASRTNSRK
jgi:hypothetical protein